MLVAPDRRPCTHAVDHDVLPIQPPGVGARDHAHNGADVVRLSDAPGWVQRRDHLERLLGLARGEQRRLDWPGRHRVDGDPALPEVLRQGPAHLLDGAWRMPREMSLSERVRGVRV